MSLAIIILLIILVPAIPFFCLLKKRKWKFWLDESSLHVQPLFWLLVFIPLIISGIAWALVSQDYELNVSTSGYSRLMENAKFPFLILALSPILGAFVTSAHRSLQTELQIKTAKEQLEEAQKKNKVDMFFLKKKQTIDYLNSIRYQENEGISNPISLYNKCFSYKSEYEVNEVTLLYSTLNNEIKELSRLYEKIINWESYHMHKHIYAHDNQIILQKLSEKFTDIYNLVYYKNNKSHLAFYKYTKSISDTLINNKENIKNVLLGMYIELLHDLYIDLSKVILIIVEIITVLCPTKDIQSLLPSIKYLINNKSDIYLKFSDELSFLTGDKLAAENQNPPE